MNAKCTGVNVFSGEPVELRFDRVITAVDTLIDTAMETAGAGPLVSPGFIDLQVNGFAGVDYNSPSAPHHEISRSIRLMFATGVTRFYPTIITGGPDDIVGALRNLASAKESIAEGPAMEGYHVEGPFISPEDGPRGAHPQRWARRPDLEEYRRWQDAARGEVKLITISPEWPEAPAFIETIVRDGVVASIGHTKATGEQIQACVAAGATMSTHLGNGAHSVMARHPNYIWEQLAEDRLTASFIVDGIHLGAAFLKTAIRAKGVERSVLVTDAVMPAGCEPGPYKLGEVEVELHPDQSVRLRGGTRLAGSALRMHDAVMTAVRLAKISLREAITMATINAARIGRVNARQRGLQPGDRADFVRFEVEDGRMRVLDTWMSGQMVYSV